MGGILLKGMTPVGSAHNNPDFYRYITEWFWYVSLNYSNSSRVRYNYLINLFGWSGELEVNLGEGQWEGFE